MRPYRSVRVESLVGLLVLSVVFVLASPTGAEETVGGWCRCDLLNVPTHVPASSGFAVSVRVINTGMVPVRNCFAELGRVTTASPCVTLGYRFWVPPRRRDVDSVDTVPLLAPDQPLMPGEARERHVQLYSPRRSAQGTLHLCSGWRLAQAVLRWRRPPRSS